MLTAAAATRETIRSRLERTRHHVLERTYRPTLVAATAVFCVLLGALVVSVAIDSRLAFVHSGIGFLVSGTWNPAANEYGAGLLIVGTIVTTALALLAVVPLGVGTAIALSEIVPRWIAAPLSAAVDLLAAVPSIVVGLWALFVLSPIFARDVEPFLKSIPVINAAFHGPAYGPGILLASTVLAVMALPTCIALSRTALRGVPMPEREGALALGATRWQVVRRVVLPGARPGIVSAITLAAGRALGESIAVAMVIGNAPSIPHSLAAPGATLGSAIVNEFAESSPGLGTSSVIALALVLLLLTCVVNIGGRAALRTAQTE
jgi:phosphate transport system permease protein